MIVSVFRSRLKPGVANAYGPMAKRMSELARAMPGYISHKGFVAEDGERVTIVEFATEEALHAWRIDPDHAEAKRHGIKDFFSEFSFQICQVIRDRSWKSKPRLTVAHATEPTPAPPKPETRKRRTRAKEAADGRAKPKAKPGRST